MCVVGIVDIQTYRVSVYLCFFFFFKQKTAYEMRISDWSSDVCSSDLLEYAHGLIFANIWQQDRIAIIDPADGTVLSWIELGALEIGRASCRERVCQYV